MATSSELDQKLTEKDNAILKAMDNLEIVQVEKHNLEVKLMELSESIRQGKKLLSKLKIEHEGLEREKWIALRREQGRM